jgi:hypothetical protein
MTKAQLTAQLEQVMDDYEAVARAYDRWHCDRTQMAATYHRLDAEIGFLRQQNPAIRGKWRRDLMTTVVSLDYDFAHHLGTLTTPPECCADMDGAISLFRSIDPLVQRIETKWTTGRLDATYARKGVRWVAHEEPR